jgi:hypothetical protein
MLHNRPVVPKAVAAGASSISAKAPPAAAPAATAAEAAETAELELVQQDNSQLHEVMVRVSGLDKANLFADVRKMFRGLQVCANDISAYFNMLFAQFNVCVQHPWTA